MGRDAAVEVSVLGEKRIGNPLGVGLASASRSLDVGGVYVEITVYVEGARWGGRIGNRLTIYPRPSVPIDVMLFVEDWPSPATLESSEIFSFALDEATEQAVRWVKRFVLSLPVEAR